MDETTREEHLAFCKRRALQYVEAGDLHNALASMVSDLGKHPGTRASAGPHLMMLGAFEIQRGPEAMRRYIEGFN